MPMMGKPALERAVRVWPRASPPLIHTVSGLSSLTAAGGLRRAASPSAPGELEAALKKKPLDGLPAGAPPRRASTATAACAGSSEATGTKLCLAKSQRLRKSCTGWPSQRESRRAVWNCSTPSAEARTSSVVSPSASRAPTMPDQRALAAAPVGSAIQTSWRAGGSASTGTRISTRLWPAEVTLFSVAGPRWSVAAFGANLARTRSPFLMARLPFGSVVTTRSLAKDGAAAPKTAAKTARRRMRPSILPPPSGRQGLEGATHEQRERGLQRPVTMASRQMKRKVVDVRDQRRHQMAAYEIVESTAKLGAQVPACVRAAAAYVGRQQSDVGKGNEVQSVQRPGDTDGLRGYVQRWRRRSSGGRVPRALHAKATGPGVADSAYQARADLNAGLGSFSQADRRSHATA